MNTPSPIASLASSASSILPVLRLRSGLVSKGLIVLLGFGLLTGASRIQAQSDESDGAASTSSVDEATASETSANLTPHFVIQNLSFSLPGEHTTGAEAVPTKSMNGFEGTIDFTCELVSGTKAEFPPECIMYPGSASITANGTANPQILIFGKGTKLPAGVASNDHAPWMALGGGSAALAFGLLFGIPARRRGWKAMLPIALLLVSFGSFSACVATPKIISAGNYSFKVIGKSAKNAAITSTGTVQIRVL